MINYHTVCVATPPMSQHQRLIERAVRRWSDRRRFTAEQVSTDGWMDVWTSHVRSQAKLCSMSIKTEVTQSKLAAELMAVKRKKSTF